LLYSRPVPQLDEPLFDYRASTVYYQLTFRCSGSRCESGAAPQLYRGTTAHNATAIRGKAGRSENPKPGDRPDNFADYLPRGGWLQAYLARCSLSCATHWPPEDCLLPPAWDCPRHEGGYADWASLQFTFIFAAP